MEKWICKVCGYTHQGDNAPESCPKCGASRYQFYRDKRSNWGAFGIVLIIMIMGALVYTFLSCSSTLTVDNSPVKNVDLNKYLGNWYEVARFDHSFERDMTNCTAFYTLKDDGTIKVTNRGLKDGKWKTSIGKCKTTDHPGVLRVSFFGPFYSDYRILMLATDYSYSLVGGSDNDYLWILSRTPEIKKSDCDKILSEAKSRGYDTSKLIWVKQDKATKNMQ